MGKRKRIDDRCHNSDLPSSSDDMPCSSGTELLPKENFSNLADGGVNIGGGSVKQTNKHSNTHQRHYLGRSLLKRSRHYHHGHQYSHKNSGNFPSTPHWKSSPLHHDGLLFKLASQHSSESRRRGDGRGKAFNRPERIRSSSLMMDSLSLDGEKTVCGICQRPLRRRPYYLGNALSSGELAVVAVLVCGHVYHADCLEQKTGFEERHDPSCPLCSGLSPDV